MILHAPTGGLLDDMGITPFRGTLLAGRFHFASRAGERLAMTYSADDADAE